MAPKLPQFSCAIVGYICLVRNRHRGWGGGEQLFVDTSRLEAAGNVLQELDFPVAPAPIVVAGTDPVSAAIKETLPIIESPVTEGLPAVKAALTRTGASIAAAAGIYSDTDQRLGDHVNRVEFLAGEEQSAGAASGTSARGSRAGRERRRKNAGSAGRLRHARAEAGFDADARIGGAAVRSVCPDRGISPRKTCRPPCKASKGRRATCRAAPQAPPRRRSGRPLTEHNWSMSRTRPTRKRRRLPAAPPRATGNRGASPSSQRLRVGPRPQPHELRSDRNLCIFRRGGHGPGV